MCGAYVCVYVCVCTCCQSAQKRRDADSSRLQATAESARDALKAADEAKLALQFKCGELVVALEDLNQQKDRLTAQLHKEREEARLVLCKFIPASPDTPFDVQAMVVSDSIARRQLPFDVRVLLTTDGTCEGKRGAPVVSPGHQRGHHPAVDAAPEGPVCDD